MTTTRLPRGRAVREIARQRGAPHRPGASDLVAEPPADAHQARELPAAQGRRADDDSHQLCRQLRGGRWWRLVLCEWHQGRCPVSKGPSRAGARARGAPRRVMSPRAGPVAARAQAARDAPERAGNTTGSRPTNVPSSGARMAKNGVVPASERPPDRPEGPMRGCVSAPWAATRPAPPHAASTCNCMIAAPVCPVASGTRVRSRCVPLTAAAPAA